MKKKVLSLVFILAIISHSHAQWYTFVSGGLTRQYYLYLPENLQSQAPLMFVLHGYSGSAEGIMDYSMMNQIADTAKFAVCYPQGTSDRWGNNFWNVGYSFHQDETVDDVAFLSELAIYLQQTYQLSSQYTFCTGMSNGGDMSYLLACQASDIFKAIAPVAGCMMSWIYDSCDPEYPVPVLEIHGTADSTTYYDGDMNNDQGWGAYMPVDSAIALWSGLNMCTQTVMDTFPDIDPDDGSIVVAYHHLNGILNHQVWLYKVVDGGHDWPGSWGNMDINSSDEIWRFFKLIIDQPSALEFVREGQMPGKFILHQNYPNPFNSNTDIRFRLATEGIVNLRIFDTEGRKVQTVLQQSLIAGSYSIRFNAGHLASGVYYYVMRSGGRVLSRKMTLVR